MKMIRSKKGDSQWLSWVLLTAFMVALGVMMQNFMTGFTEDTTQSIKERVYNSEECDSVAISIDSVCQNTQSLYINLTNRRDIAISKVMFRMYDIYNGPTWLESNVTIDLGIDDTQEVIALRQGDFKKVSRLEVVPVVFKDNFEIICEDRKGAVEVIPDCIGVVKRLT